MKTPTRQTDAFPGVIWATRSSSMVSILWPLNKADESEHGLDD